MSKTKPPVTTGKLKAKTVSIASKLPATRNPDGSIKPRDKTGGAKPAAKVTPFNAGKPWSEKDDARIVLLVNAGKTDQEIADDLSRTVTGIIVRALHLKIEGYLPQGPYTLKIGQAGYPVDTLEEAQRKYMQVRDASGLGASEFSFGALVIGNVHKNPLRVATISYNGRAWQGDSDDRLLQEAPALGAATLSAPEAAAVEEVKPKRAMTWTKEKAAAARGEPIEADKPGNGAHAQTAQQIVSDVPALPAVIDPASVVATQEQPQAVEELQPAQSIELPMKFVTAALSIAPKDDTRYYLNGVFIHQLADNAIRMVATDGHRLFIAQVAHTQVIDWAQKGIILPREQLERIAKYLGKSAIALRIEYGVKHPAVKVHEVGGMAVFSFGLVDGKFPDYQKVADQSAAVFTAEREELSQTTIDSKYLKAAGALAASLESKGIIPFLAPEGASYASVFAFVDVPEALLYIAPQRGREQALPAQTVRLFGEDAMRAQVANLEEQIKRTLNNAKNAKHAKFRQQFKDKAARLQLRRDQLQANLTPALPAPAAASAPQSPATQGTAEPVAGAVVH